MLEQPNNVLYVKCTSESVYKAWMKFLTPYHNLAVREQEVAAEILKQWDRLGRTFQDPRLRREVLWSQTSKTDMRTRLGISRPHFSMVMSELRKCGMLTGPKDEINPRYIPHLREGSYGFLVAIMFDFTDKENIQEPETEKTDAEAVQD